jgi:hypothetical protein
MTRRAALHIRRLACLLGLLPGLLGCALVLAGDGQHADPPGDAPPAGKDDPLPRLPEKQLPPLTRKKPDPAHSQFLKEAVHVKVAEKVRKENGELVPQRTNVLEDYLQEYLRRAGHPIAATAEDAVFRLEGTLDARLHSTLRVRGQIVTWKFGGASTLRLVGRDGSVLENIELPELLEDNVRGEESAALQLRRRLAKLLWDKLYLDGKTLGSPKIVALLGSLVADPSEGEELTAETVVERLADAGLQAVPYLLEALTDRRVVRLPSSYPGLKGRNLDDLRVYHLADKALEEIFQKVSRMSIQIGPEDEESVRLRRVIILGWENEWRRFCRPFAESKQSKPRRKDSAGTPNPAPAAEGGGAPK